MIDLWVYAAPCGSKPFTFPSQEGTTVLDIASVAVLCTVLASIAISIDDKVFHVRNNSHLQELIRQYGYYGQTDAVATSNLPLSLPD